MKDFLKTTYNLTCNRYGGAILFGASHTLLNTPSWMRASKIEICLTFSNALGRSIVYTSPFTLIYQMTAEKNFYAPAIIATQLLSYFATEFILEKCIADKGDKLKSDPRVFGSERKGSYADIFRPKTGDILAMGIEAIAAAYFFSQSFGDKVDAIMRPFVDSAVQMISRG